MIAHFVGGPLNGKERALAEGQRTVAVYELNSHYDKLDYAQPLRDQPGYVNAFDEFRGEYQRANFAGPRAFPNGMPAIFVWVDERPFKFVVSVDAVPNASRELAENLVREIARHAENLPEAFTGGIRKISVGD